MNQLELHIEDGEFLVFVRPSGCGKSTSLRMLAGLDSVDVGRVYIGERDVTNTEPKDRDIAMVFQDYALYPHMTVADWRLLVPRTVTDAAGADTVTVGVRPEHFAIGDGGFEIEVAVVEELGADPFVYGHGVGSDDAIEVVARADWRHPPAKGSSVRLSADPEHAHFFGADGRRIS